MLAPWHVGALAMGLAAAALWPLAAVFNWFGVNVATLEQMSRSDPAGFRFLPATLLFARPIVAVAATLAMPVVAVRVVTSRPQLAVQILVKGAITQTALVLVLALGGPPINSTLARLMPMYPNRHTPGALVTAGHFVNLQEAAAASVLPWLAGIAAACALLAVLARTALKGVPGARAG
jgi:hypothetical protein